MATITSTMSRFPGPTKPCVWCQQPTDTLADTPFRPDWGAVPLHIGCGIEVLRAYEQWRWKRTLSADQQSRIGRMLA